MIFCLGVGVFLSPFFSFISFQRNDFLHTFSYFKVWGKTKKILFNISSTIQRYTVESCMINCRDMQ